VVYWRPDGDNALDLVDACELGKASAFSPSEDSADGIGSLRITRGGTREEIRSFRERARAAHDYSADISDKVQRGRKRWAGKSSWGGRRPYGRMIDPAAPKHAKRLTWPVLPGLAEGEAVGLNPWTGEGYLEGALGDGAGLADELVHPLLRQGAGAGAGAVGVGVGPVCLAGWLSVDTDAKPQRRSWRGPHDEVEVAGVEAAGDLAARRVQRGGLFLHGPVPR